MIPLDWNKTPRHENTQLAKRRVWKTKCGHFRVEEHTILYGVGKDKSGNETGMPTYYLAMMRHDWGWQIISEHRKRATAIKALEYLHENGHKMPPKSDPIKAAKRKRIAKKAKSEELDLDN